MATKKEDSIKTKLQFEGEAEYKKAAAEINSSLYTMSLEMKKVTADFADNAKGTEALTAKQEILQRQQAEQIKKIEETQKALANLETQENRNEKAITEYKNKLLLAQTALAKTSNELNGVEKEMAQAGSETEEFTAEIKKAGNEAEDTGSKFEGLGKTLGTIGKAFGTAVAAIGTAALAAGTALAGMTVAAAKNADDLLTQSTVLRQSTDDLQKYAYAARFIDVEMNTLTGSMTKNIKSMNDARNGSKIAAEAYDQLGISLTNADGTLRDSNEVYWQTIDALHNVTNETERDALAMSVLGKSATDLNSVINAGSAAFKEMGDEAEAMGLIISGDSLNQLGDFDDKLQQLSASLGGLKNAASMIALPFMDILAGEGTNILAEFSNGIQVANGDITELGDIVGKTLGNIVSMITAHLPEIMEMGVNIVTALVEGIADNVGNLATAAVSIVETLVNALANMLPTLLQGAVTLVQGLAQGIAAQLPTLIPVVIEMILTLVQGIAENLPILIDSAIMIIDGLVTGILNALPILVDMLPQIIITIVNGLIEGIPKILAAAGRIIKGLIDGLISAIPDLLASIPYIISAIVNGLVSGLPDIIASAADIMMSLIFGLMNAIPELIGAIPQIIFAIVDAFTSGESNFFDIGVNIIKGLWEGMKSMFATLLENVKNFFGNLIDGIKDFLGIHSPSTVFAGLGENMAQGIGAGFTEEMQQVTDGIMAAIPTDFDTDSEISFIAKPAETGATSKKAAKIGLLEAEEASALPHNGGFQVIQNIYTPQYNYAEQQRAAAQQLRQIARRI